MYRFKAMKCLSAYLLTVFLLFNTSVLFAQKIVESSAQSAGFSFATGNAATEPVIHYQQKIEMLSGIDDRLSLSVFGNGQVLVHFPVHMKKAGEYELWLTRSELVRLIQKLSRNGIMDFDHGRVKAEKNSHDLKMKARGQLHYVSDAHETIVDIRLKDYQKTASHPLQPNLRKRFAWKNLEQDARYYKNNRSIQSAAMAIKALDELMHHKKMKKVK